MPMFDEEAPKKKAGHEIGSDLSRLSVDELTELTRILRDEISRIEAAIAEKRKSADVAASFFKR